MLRVPIVQAKAGMKLSAPVWHPKRAGTVLLRAGMTLDDLVVKRLRELYVREIYIEYPGLAHLAEYINPEVREAGGKLACVIQDALDTLLVHPSARLDYRSYNLSVRALLEKLVKHPKAGIFIDDLAQGDYPGLRHACTVCLISLLLGLKLDTYLVHQRKRLSAAAAKDVSALGVGAIFHDVGLMRIEPAVLERYATTGDEDDPLYRRHPELGYDMVKDYLDPSASACVLHHHQRFNGSGFPVMHLMDNTPKRLAGQDIHIFARIVAAADLFDRLRYPPSGLGPSNMTPVPAVRALRKLRQRPYRAWLDPVVNVAMLHVIPAYPPGSMVTLSDGREGVVTAWDPLDPCRPTVQIVDGLLFDDRHPAEVIDLRGRPTLQVAVAEGQNVLADNFYPLKPNVYDLTRAMIRLTNRAVDLQDRSVPKKKAA